MDYSPEEDYDELQTPVQEANEKQEAKEKDCNYGEPITESGILIETRIEKYKNELNRLIKLNNKLKEYGESREKYSKNIQYILEEPKIVELSVIQETLEKCNSDRLQEQHGTTQDKYYLSKYEKIGNQLLSEFIKKNQDILNIKDLHFQLLNTIKELYERTKIVHYDIKNNNIIVKETDQIPVITNFTSRGFIVEEINIDNFETFLTEADDYQCIEAHILVYLGKKKKNENWKTLIYSEEQHTNAIQSHMQSKQSYSEYIGNTYEQVYQNIIKTLLKWDIYSITKIILDILLELNDPLLQNYQNSLTEVLSKKTTELEYTLPIITESSLLPEELPITEQ
jgi:hypothetical protein